MFSVIKCRRNTALLQARIVLRCGCTWRYWSAREIVQANDKPAVNTQILKQHPSHATRFTNAYVSRGTGTPVPAETRVKLEKLSYKKILKNRDREPCNPSPKLTAFFSPISSTLFNYLSIRVGKRSPLKNERLSTPLPQAAKGLFFFFFLCDRSIPLPFQPPPRRPSAASPE